MKSKYINFLLNENEINKIAKEVGLCSRIRKFTSLSHEFLQSIISVTSDDILRFLA